MRPAHCATNTSRSLAQSAPSSLGASTVPAEAPPVVSVAAAESAESPCSCLSASCGFSLGGRFLLRFALGFLARLLGGGKCLLGVGRLGVGVLFRLRKVALRLVELVFQLAQALDLGLVAAVDMRHILKRREEIHDVLGAEDHFQQAGRGGLRLVQLHRRGGAALLLGREGFLDLGDARLVVGDLLVQVVDAVYCLVVFGGSALDLLLCGIGLHVRVDVLRPCGLLRKARDRHACEGQRRA